MREGNEPRVKVARESELTLILLSSYERASLKKNCCGMYIYTYIRVTSRYGCYNTRRACEGKKIFFFSHGRSRGKILYCITDRCIHKKEKRKTSLTRSRAPVYHSRSVAFVISHKSFTSPQYAIAKPFADTLTHAYRTKRERERERERESE